MELKRQYTHETKEI